MDGNASSMDRRWRTRTRGSVLRPPRASLHAIVAGSFVSPPACSRMRHLLRRSLDPGLNDGPIREPRWMASLGGRPYREGEAVEQSRLDEARRATTPPMWRLNRPPSLHPVVFQPRVLPAPTDHTLLRSWPRGWPRPAGALTEAGGRKRPARRSWRQRREKPGHQRTERRDSETLDRSLPL